MRLVHTYKHFLFYMLINKSKISYLPTFLLVEDKKQTQIQEPLERCSLPVGCLKKNYEAFETFEAKHFAQSTF